MGKSLIHQSVQIPGLMRAMEIAEANMHDARGQLGAVVKWDPNAIGHVR